MLAFHWMQFVHLFQYLPSTSCRNSYLFDRNQSEIYATMRNHDNERATSGFGAAKLADANNAVAKQRQQRDENDTRAPLQFDGWHGNVFVADGQYKQLDSPLIELEHHNEVVRRKTKKEKRMNNKIFFFNLVLA